MLFFYSKDLVRTRKKLILRQQLSKNNDARLIVIYSDTVMADNSVVLGDSDKIDAAVAWHH
ncbi:hypothetical protein ACTXGQ_20230, partial [Marinobacter sp. 1Y8]